MLVSRRVRSGRHPAGLRLRWSASLPLIVALGLLVVFGSLGCGGRAGEAGPAGAEAGTAGPSDGSPGGGAAGAGSPAPGASSPPGLPQPRLGPEGAGLVLGGLPWRSGDRARYDLFVQGKKMGTLLLTVAPGDKDGMRAVVFTNDITAGSLRESSVAWAHPTTLQALASEINGSTPQGSYTVTGTYGSGAVKVEASAPGQTPQSGSLPVPEYCWDNEQFLSSIRALPLVPGYSGKVAVVSTKAFAPAECSIRVEGREKVSVLAGTFECYRVALDFQGATQYGWYSTDPSRRLVKYVNAEAGSAFALVEAGGLAE
ncbi:MAG: DUF3108 domain-containing protein [Acetobacteraceae bacterium]|nr:DUF3108 domain-containing protein [Acetobacteraceae bacterium]